MSEISKKQLRGFEKQLLNRGIFTDIRHQTSSDGGWSWFEVKTRECTPEEKTQIKSVIQGKFPRTEVVILTR